MVARYSSIKDARKLLVREAVRQLYFPHRKVGTAVLVDGLGGIANTIADGKANEAQSEDEREKTSTEERTQKLLTGSFHVKGSKC